MFQALDIGLDIGNSKFSICVKGAGVVASESAWLAYRGGVLSDATVLAFGDEAKRMHERAHPGIAVMSPMSEGVVVDCRAASILLKRLVKKAGLRWALSKPKVVVGALYGSSDIERKAFIDVAESLGCAKPYVVHEPLAAAIGTHLDVGGPYANMILDIGDGATEAVIMSQRQTILGSSMRYGGSNIDAAMVDHIRKHHGLKISVSQARKIKEEITLLYDSLVRNQMITVKGVDVNGLLPCDRQIPVASVLRVLEKFSDKVVAFVMNLLAQVPPEVSVDLIENGIYLCGGASQTSLIQERLVAATGLRVTPATDPQQAVIAGIYRMLEFTPRYA